jgi:hypothetical protein
MYCTDKIAQHSAIKYIEILCSKQLLSGFYPNVCVCVCVCVSFYINAMLMFDNVEFFFHIDCILIICFCVYYR